jgi:DNA-binding MarR family transcriptional regulator
MEEISKGIKIIRTMKQIMSAVRQGMEKRFGGMKLTAPQGMLIGTLAHGGEMKISDLSEKLGLSNSTVSGIVDRLEKQGLVERVRSEEDRRVVYVNLSPEFRENSKGHFHEFERNFEAMMKEATPEELDTILQGLDTLKQVIDRQIKGNEKQD